MRCDATKQTKNESGHAYGDAAFEHEAPHRMFLNDIRLWSS
jgi:hypothetical protein